MRAERLNHGQQAKRTAVTREKRKHRTSPATRLKVAMKRKRDRARSKALRQARELKGKHYEYGYPSRADVVRFRY